MSYTSNPQLLPVTHDPAGAPKKSGIRPPRRRPSLQDTKAQRELVGALTVSNELPESPEVPAHEEDDDFQCEPPMSPLGKDATIPRSNAVSAGAATGHKRTSSMRSLEHTMLSDLYSDFPDLNLNGGGKRKPDAYRPPRGPRRSSGGSAHSANSDRTANSRAQRLMQGRETKRVQCTKVVLKFTSIADDGTSQPPVCIDAVGGSVGRARTNKVCVPNDDSLADEEHARVYLENGGFYVQDVAGRHGVALRVAAGTGLQDWPLEPGTVFVAGLTEFTVTKIDVNDIEITLTGGPAAGQTLQITKAGATIGRSTDNVCVVTDRELSRKHCSVEYDGMEACFFLCDIGSTNGTYVRMQGPYSGRLGLGLGDHIMIGRTAFSVNRYDFGVSEEIGRRPSMEDRTMVVQDLGVTALQKVGLSPQTYAAVYDGHGGVAASSFLWQKLHMNIAEALRRNATRITTILNGKLAKLAGSEALRELDDVVCRMLKEAFLTTDYEFINSSRQNTDGSTASTVLMLGSRLYCANVGDSRTVRYNSITHRVPNRGSVKVLKRGSQVFPLSQDHVPYREDEQARIERAGGFVLYRRVMGELAVSRAFGDAEFKTSTAGRGVVCEEPLTSPRADAGHPPASPHAEDVVPQQSLSEQLNDLLSPKIKPKTRARRGPAYTPKTVLEPDRPVERSRASSERENEEEIFARANSLAICVAEQAEASDSKKVAEALSRPKTRSPRFSDVLPSPLQMNRKGLQAVDRRSDKPGAPTPSPSLVMSPIAAQEPLSPGPRRGPTRRSLGEPQNSVPGSMMVRMPGHAHRGRKATSEGLLPDDEEDRCIGGDEMSAPGNALFAKTIITAEPDIVVRELEEGADDMLLMACDGLFDVFSNEEACEAAAREYKRLHDAQQVAELLSHLAVHERGSRDNVSVIVMALRSATLWD